MKYWRKSQPFCVQQQFICETHVIQFMVWSRSEGNWWLVIACKWKENLHFVLYLRRIKLDNQCSFPSSIHSYMDSCEVIVRSVHCDCLLQHLKLFNYNAQLSFPCLYADPLSDKSLKYRVLMTDRLPRWRGKMHWAMKRVDNYLTQCHGNHIQTDTTRLW